MTGFVLAALVMGTIAMAFVLFPSLRRPPGKGAGAEAVNVEVFRSQKREIEDEFKRGLITSAERDLALTELTNRVAEEIPIGVSHGAASRDDRAWPDCDVANVGTEPGHPLHQKALPQADRPSDGEMIAVLIRQAHLELSVLPYAHKCERVLLELLPGVSRLRARF